jgi:hypothetical protein
MSPQTHPLGNNDKFQGIAPYPNVPDLSRHDDAVVRIYLINTIEQSIYLSATFCNNNLSNAFLFNQLLVRNENHS